ncbi:hypothetical protein JQ604_24795 [Bradyrhizobium jicamae]|uniref:DUF7662 domain-containing protein n=1 Tax=Bradyrhizobium jicamae TaxID=280332 RepID=UPI001BACCD8B|nr:hypothetical protein [Bradyrhizobium jicamae]MBR0755410.1 hypothetical protein [Bradyrhizobium jicamae]
MSVYDPLRQRLETVKGASIRLSFADLEAILGKPLPVSAYKFTAWWGNNCSVGHAQTRAWLSAGFEARTVSLKNRTVEFHRIGKQAG